MKTPDLLESIISLLRQHGPMKAEELQRWMESQGQSVTFAALASTMMAEEARDWRTRRLRRATGYPPGYYIAFDNNAGRD